jgi:hypothetical protein
VYAAVAELAIVLIDVPGVEVAEVLPVDPGMIAPIPFVRPKDWPTRPCPLVRMEPRMAASKTPAP